MKLRLVVHPQRAAVCRLAPEAAVPDWVRGSFTSVTRTHAELSIVCDEDGVPADVRCDRDWRVLETVGPFAFDVTGVASRLSGALADRGVPLLLIATFDTDYILVQSSHLDEAIDALRAAGHDVS